MATSVYSGTIGYLRRKSKRIRKSGWKAAFVWYGIVAVVVLFAVNWAYQVARKPGEILAPISASLAKTPEATWQSYGSLFEKHSTDIISPEFLAALAQVEGSGNPIASTYWRWRWDWNPFEIYRPASSAVGMFQITDGTFAEARKYCIRENRLVAAGPWHDLRSCWFNSFYSRTVPSHSIELTAVYLHRSVQKALATRGQTLRTAAQQEKLAAVIHLCGLGRGESFAKRGFRVARADRCGTHRLARYLSKIELMRKRFVRLRAQSRVP